MNGQQPYAHTKAHLPHEDIAKEKHDHHPPKNKRLVSHTMALGFNLAAIYVANNILNWNVTFITEDFNQILGLINFSIIATAVLNFVFIFYDKMRFYFLARSVLDIITIIVMYNIFKVFPFDFSGEVHIFSITTNSLAWLNTWAPYIFILGIIGTIIGLVVRFFKFANKK
ncbi:hypothetical protein KKF61_04580, partial [Patescibacteria group bacterium]|nr:hypothetical protein [Patescibacteria group bacterium]